MERNEGTVDRIIRVVLGLAILSLVFVGPKTAWGLLGVVPLVTGAWGYCPLYQALGIQSCRLSGPKPPAPSAT